MATLTGGHVDGTPDDDVIFGEGQDYVLNGKGGDDTITGPSGFDGTITGGQGDDSIVAARGSTSIDGGGGDDVVELARTYFEEQTLDGGAGDDTLVLTFFVDLSESAVSNFERLELSGNIYLREDQVVDSSGANLLEIGSENWERATLHIYADGGRMDLSQLEIDGPRSDRGGAVALIGATGPDTLVGSSYGDGFFGLGGDDRLYGGAGNDGFSGGRGDDTLIGGEGDDRFDGDEGEDRLVGGEGDDELIGGLGADVMIGGEGDDFYFVDDAGDVVHDGAGRGTDRVQSQITYTLGKDVENLLLGGSGAIDGTGNAAGNVIAGNAEDNVIDGGAGADTLTGGRGRGGDVFAFSSKLGPGNVDHVTDFGTGDQLQLASSVFVGLEVGGIAPGMFVLGTEAQDVDDRIIYDTVTGQLRFDRDGAGGADAVLFAILDGAPELSADDFVIV